MRSPSLCSFVVILTLLCCASAFAQKNDGRDPRKANPKDGRNQETGKAAPERDPALAQFGIYEKVAPLAPQVEPRETSLPLQLKNQARVALIGNTLFDRARHFGHVEALIQQRFPEQELVFRNLSWSGDTVSSQPRPENFANVQQHLTHERADIILAAFGFNESFAGEEGLEEFRAQLTEFLRDIKTRAFNGETAPQVVLISPIANEDVGTVLAGELNNVRLRQYTEAMQQVAKAEGVGFADVFATTESAMRDPRTDLTSNGAHLNEEGYALFARTLFTELFNEQPPALNETIRQLVIDKDQQYFRRYRPLNTFYYTGGRNQAYGYLDFLPAMRNFDLLTASRDQLIWEVAAEGPVQDVDSRLAEARAKLLIEDQKLPPLPETEQSRGANEWLSPVEEYSEFDIDPRFAVNIFADETMFPELACPIQMRWDARGRLWVSCSTTYPHVYPGNEPDDKLIILEDTDQDGRADKCSTFADDLHIPLSFEFGDGGVYVSEMPDLTFLKDTDGDGKADLRKRVLTGFGTEDSHHALHDFTWTPDGDLIWRESIFHHSQVETPYGPINQQNSGWFRFQPRTQQLISFGTYPSTNPWGVTFDYWGQHMASHPVYAAAFHALDPPYPVQHTKPGKEIQAYSGTCGQEFVDFATFPDELLPQADGTTHFVKVRYKPTNRVEIHKWVEGDFGYEEKYEGDLLFSKNLSFIPVDLKYGPRGAMYICDWYNPVKGHAQYSLRDERRDRHSGRIWRIVGRGKPLQEAPNIADASIPELLDLLKRPEHRVRYWAKRELRDRDAWEALAALDKWVQQLDPAEASYRHHQLEAIWAYRWLGAADYLPVPVKTQLPKTDVASAVAVKTLRELLVCEDHHARAAAVQQLRYWSPQLDDAEALLQTAANDSNGIVRMEAAIAATYFGTKPALDSVLDTFKYPRGGHLDYAITCALGSKSLRQHWEGNPNYNIEAILKAASQEEVLKEPEPTAEEKLFDGQKNLKSVRMGCVPERMKYTVESFYAKPGQPVKIVFENPDATNHNLVFVQPGAVADVGVAANAMAKDPKNAESDFLPADKADLIMYATPMIGPTKPQQITVLRFEAPTEPGVYPYLCTFPGHWIIMQGRMVVAPTREAADELLAASGTQVVQEWKLADFAGFETTADAAAMTRGQAAFLKARCNQCHQHSGQGVKLGPDLTRVGERLKGEKLLRTILEPSFEIHKDYQMWQFLTNKGQVLTGFIKEENEQHVTLIPNLLTPDVTQQLGQREIEVRKPSAISPMPEGLLNRLTREEIIDLVSWLQIPGDPVNN
ncbi:MAG: c-type cytochrome [Planctomycetaceae bacterium]|nr:c-type cytochrome [Planctomycetaceae bacterium]